MPAGTKLKVLQKAAGETQRHSTVRGMMCEALIGKDQRDSGVQLPENDTQS